MVLIGTYLLNLLCAMVPCQMPLPPPQAFIGEFVDNNLSENATVRQKRLPLRTTSVENENGLNFRSSLGSVSSNAVISESENRESYSRSVDFNVSSPIVWTDAGGVEGYFMGTMRGRKINAFEGIPYAEPPVGELRFKTPVRKSPWNGVRRVQQPGSTCLQAHPLHFFRISGTENCLFLNVYSPKIHKRGANKQLLPVLFFIHGGSFMYGSGTEYGPAYLLDQDIILVTFNYRLGALGFLSTGDEASPGNYGLKDQALALKWVHDNIAKFGGDPERVTLMGQSAGGVSAHLHLISNKTTEYFRAGISLSGNGFGHWPVLTKAKAKRWTDKLSNRLRCPTKDSFALIDCLRRIGSSFISAAEQQIYDWIPFHPLVIFAPVVESPAADAFLIQSPAEAYGNNTVSQFPWIFSFTAQEGHFEVYLIKLFMQAGNVANNIRKYLPLILDYAYTEEPIRTQITDQIMTFYSQDNTEITLETVSDMYTDRLFAFPVHKALQAHSQVASAYGYVFDYKGKYNLGTLFGIPETEWGKSHTEDLFYFFNSSSYHHGLRRNDPEYKLSEIMVNIVANFAANRVPTYVDPEGIEMDMWKEAISIKDKGKVEFLQFNEDIKMIDSPFTKKVQFWDSVVGLKDT